VIHCENLVKIYKTGESEVLALQGLDLTVEQGEMAAIIGNSGSGKSTLLNIIGGLDKPSAGKVLVDGRDLSRFTEKDTLAYQRETIGFVWQNNARNLIPYLSARQNVELPMKFLGNRESHLRAAELLDMVGLSHRLGAKLSEMSGGEVQRVAIAIALSNRPRLLLADEPTGSLDTANTIEVLKVFREVNKAFGITILMVTHDPRLARSVDRVVAIRDGRCSSEFLRKDTGDGDLSDLGNSFEDIDKEEMTSHEELIVIDKAGRLQIPQEYLKSIGISDRDKVRVRLDGTRIVITAKTDIQEP
jgi:ABC-type lipoprotein export system ATPase subunit